MVVIIEPGICLSSWAGVRIENSVTENGCEMRHTYPKERIQL